MARRLGSVRQRAKKRPRFLKARSLFTQTQLSNHDRSAAFRRHCAAAANKDNATSCHSPIAPPPPLLPPEPPAAAATVKAAVPLAVPPAPVQARAKLAVPAALGLTLKVPLVASAPLHAPLAVQEVAFVEDQVTVAPWPTVIEVGDTAIVTVGRGGAAVTVKEAVAFALPPAPVQVST